MQMDMPHYHHSSTCAEIILDAYIDGGPGVQGEGMTAFIKLGVGGLLQFYDPESK